MSVPVVPRHIMDLARDPNLKATVRLGRNGLTESIIEEIRVQLAARSLVKIRLNRGFADGMMASAHRGRDEVVRIGLARRALQELTVETGAPKVNRRDVTKKCDLRVLRCCGAFTLFM